jgi:oxygen-independent coproporphyrinogen-3 oxidase
VLRGTGTFREEAAQVEEMFSDSSKLLSNNRYSPYYLYRQKNTLGNFENVGYSKPGLAGLYNIYIMGEYQTILSAGAGGVTKVVSCGGTRMERIWNYKYPYEYIDNFSKTEENIKKTMQLLMAP